MFLKENMFLDPQLQSKAGKHDPFKPESEYKELYIYYFACLEASFINVCAFLGLFGCLEWVMLD